MEQFFTTMRQAPLAAEGANFEFVMNYEATVPGKDTYAGKMSWEKVEFAAKRYIAVPLGYGGEIHAFARGILAR